MRCMGDCVVSFDGAEVRPLYECKRRNDKRMQHTVAQPDDRLRSVMLAVGAQQKLQGRELLAVFIDFACQTEMQE